MESIDLFFSFLCNFYVKLVNYNVDNVDKMLTIVCYNGFKTTGNTRYLKSFLLLENWFRSELNEAEEVVEQMRVQDIEEALD